MTYLKSVEPFQRRKGFSLIELMIAVAIVGILSAIAIPIYTGYYGQANRTDAKSALLQTAQFLERNFTEAGSYNNTSASVSVALPISQSPPSGNANYLIGATTLNATQYTITATRTGAQAADECGDFSLDQFGNKTIANNSSSVTAAFCWGN